MKSLIAPQAGAARLPRPLPPLSAVRPALPPSRARRAFLGSGIAKRTASGLQLERQPIAASRQGQGSRNSNHRDRASFERCFRETSRTPSAPSPPPVGNETTPLVCVSRNQQPCGPQVSPGTVQPRSRFFMPQLAGSHRAACLREPRSPAARRVDSGGLQCALA